MNLHSTPERPFQDLPESSDLAQPRPRLDGWTPERQKLFLEALSRCGSVKSAAALAGCSRESVYRLKRRRDAKAFSRAWDAALIHARDLYADELLEKGLNGWTEAVWHNGEETGTREKWSAPLFLAALARLDEAANRLDRDDSPTHQAASQFDEMVERIGAGDDCEDLIAAQNEEAELAGQMLTASGTNNTEILERLKRGYAMEEIEQTPPEEIDTSDLDEADMDEWDDLQWARAERGGFLKKIGFYNNEPEDDLAAGEESKGAEEEGENLCELPNA